MTTTLSPPLPSPRSLLFSPSSPSRSNPRSNGDTAVSSAPGTDMSIRVEHVSKSFSAYPALNDVSLTMRDREFVALLGPSGSGKTTLAQDPRRPRSARERQGAGSASATSPDDKPASRGIGFVFQHYALFGHMTVAQNIAFGLDVMRPRSASETRFDARVDELLELVQLPGLRQALSEPALRRPAPARRACPRARPPAAHPASRRAVRRSRRQGPPRASRRASPDPRRARPHLDLRHP